MAERRVRSPLRLLTRTLAAGALAALVLLLDPGPLAAQGGIITGRVTDAEVGEGVTQVLVEVVAGAARPVRTATTDESGGFQVTGVPAGTYSLVFSRIAYETKRIDGVTVGEGVTAVGDVSLISRAFRLNPIVVSASKREEKALEAPAAVSVIDRREIEERPATTAVDHVKDVKGADVVTTGLAQHNVVSRGFNNIFSGALFVLTDNRWASVPSLRFNAYNMIPATSEDIDRIEFVLGPGSALYGPNVDKGVMHIITRSPLETQETTLSLVGGEREVGQAAFRHAGLFSENVGYKISGTYFQGRDWRFTEDAGETEAAAAAQACLDDPVFTNPDCTPFVPAPGQDPDVARLQRVGTRDFDAERFAGEARLDFRLGEETGLVLSSGVSQLGNSIEMTGIGAAQARDWRYTYVQARLRHKELFAQAYMNFSDAGDTYLLREGSRIEDNSFLYVGQVQHGLSVGERQRFIYGLDFIQTIPRTDGTINGVNEEDDDITEVGGYVQSETRLSPQFDLVAAGRLDYHSVVEDLVVSPRVAVVFKPQPGHNFRATYNRAFSQPTTNNLFLDRQVQPLTTGLPFEIRVTGVPSQGGLRFVRDGSGQPMMRVPPQFGGPDQYLPLDVTPFWPVAVNIFCTAQPGVCAATNLQGAPTPTSVEVGTVMRTLDPTTGSFSTDTDVDDIPPLESSITNTFEIGYNGLIGDRLSFSLDLYYSRIQDFVGPLIVETPNVFLERTSLAAYLTAYLESQGFDAATAAATAGQIAAGMAGVDGQPAPLTGIPLATVTPQGVPEDPFDLYLTYRSFGDVDLWGADVGAKFFATDEFSFAGTYSFVNKNFLANVGGITDLALNAPKNKASLSGSYENTRLGLGLELRGRYVEGFPVLSGVYVGSVESYTLMDANIRYALPFARSTELTLSASNVFDDRHQEMVGAPALGRLLLLRLRQSF